MLTALRKIEFTMIIPLLPRRPSSCGPPRIQMPFGKQSLAQAAGNASHPIIYQLPTEKRGAFSR